MCWKPTRTLTMAAFYFHIYWSIVKEEFFQKTFLPKIRFFFHAPRALGFQLSHHMYYVGTILYYYSTILSILTLTQDVRTIFSSKNRNCFPCPSALGIPLAPHPRIVAFLARCQSEMVAYDEICLRGAMGMADKFKARFEKTG